jgi:hypothetical protein
MTDIVQYRPSDQELDVQQLSIQLDIAIRRNQLDVVIDCVERGADVHVDRDSPLRTATALGFLGIVCYLIEQCGADIHADRDYPLRKAALENEFDIVVYLVEHGADIHALGDCALIHASWNGNLNIVKYLVEHGAHIHTVDDLAMAGAIHGAHDHVIAYLEQQHKKLLYMAFCGHVVEDDIDIPSEWTFLRGLWREWSAILYISNMTAETDNEICCLYNVLNGIVRRQTEVLMAQILEMSCLPEQIPVYKDTSVYEWACEMYHHFH